MPNPLAPIPPALPSWAQVKEATKKFVANTQVPPRPETFNADEKPDPHAVDPTSAEDYGPFIPYRGHETHGVPMGEMTDTGPQGYGDGSVGVMYDDDSARDPVVSVRIVTDDKEEIKAFRAGQTSVGPETRQIVNRMRNRSALKIKNLSVGTRVWIGSDTTLSALNGYPLDGGAEISIASTEAVFAISSTVDVVPLATFMDFTQDV